jgi:hypothetical protein
MISSISKQRFGLLDLGHHACVSFLALVDDPFQFDDVAGTAHEAQAHPIHIVLQRELQVLLVLLGEAGQADLGIGQVQSPCWR